MTDTLALMLALLKCPVCKPRQQWPIRRSSRPVRACQGDVASQRAQPRPFKQESSGSEGVNILRSGKRVQPSLLGSSVVGLIMQGLILLPTLGHGKCLCKDGDGQVGPGLALGPVLLLILYTPTRLACWSGPKKGGSLIRPRSPTCMLLSHAIAGCDILRCNAKFASVYM